MEDGFRMILEGMGEDPNREGLIDTPKRVAKMYAELMTSLTGEMKAEDILKTRFHEKYRVIVWSVFRKSRVWWNFTPVFRRFRNA